MLEKSWVCKLDGHDIFKIDLLQKMYCLFEKTKNKRKRGRGGPICVKKVCCLVGVELVFPKCKASAIATVPLP